jgi:hypothetical protein
MRVNGVMDPSRLATGHLMLLGPTLILTVIHFSRLGGTLFGLDVIFPVVLPRLASRWFALVRDAMALLVRSTQLSTELVA